MKAEKQEYTVTNVKLTLDGKEAAWLKAAMQNPLSDIETGLDREHRQRLWHALDSVGIK